MTDFYEGDLVVMPVRPDEPPYNDEPIKRAVHSLTGNYVVLVPVGYKYQVLENIPSDEVVRWPIYRKDELGEVPGEVTASVDVNINMTLTLSGEGMTVAEFVELTESYGFESNIVNAVESALGYGNVDDEAASGDAGSLYVSGSESVSVEVTGMGTPRAS